MNLNKIALIALFGILFTGCEKGNKVALPENRVIKPEVQEAAPAQAQQTQIAAPAASVSPAEPDNPSAQNTPQEAAASSGQAIASTAPGPQQQKPPVPPPQQVQKPEGAQDASGSPKSRFSGQVSTLKKASLAFRVGGFIKEINRLQGESCRKGDILATLDPRDYTINRNMAAAQLELAKIAMDNAKREFDRETALHSEKVSTEANFDRLKLAFDKARLDLQMAQLRKQQADEAFEDTKLKAPYDCVITKLLKYEHENLGAGSPVLEIYSTTDLELSFSVPERLSGKIKVGNQLEVSIPSTGFKGRLDVIRLVPVVADSSRTFQVIVRAPKGESKIVPGLFAEAVLL
ncbi:MAG: efflux RND transporter periplasmic adaptor subunit [Oligoflexales bacterium]|nr:efflux RND transporter periplasmic adaptor subunit [Oligoflexales bacterium]